MGSGAPPSPVVGRQCAALDGRAQARPTVVNLDRATRQSTPERGHRVGYDGSKIHVAVDTLGGLLTLLATLVTAQDREAELCPAPRPDTTGASTLRLRRLSRFGQRLGGFSVMEKGPGLPFMR
jgi:hypothetical protein